MFPSGSWSGGRRDVATASGKKKAGSSGPSKTKAAKKTKASGNVTVPAKAPAKALSKKAAKAKRREIMRQDLRSFMGSRSREIERREEEAIESRRARHPFGAFMEGLSERKLQVMEIQREQMRLLQRTGPGRMGELGGTVTRAFSIPADLDEDLEEVRESLGMGRSAFYETVFEYFLRLYGDD